VGVGVVVQPVAVESSDPGSLRQTGRVLGGRGVAARFMVSG